MMRGAWLGVAFLVACGGNSGSEATPDAAPDAAPPDAPAARKLMFGIDISPAPGETYGDVLALARANGATFIPQAIDWSLIEAGPDDAFAAEIIDTKKWDVTGAFAADAAGKRIRYMSAQGTTGDNLRARYVLGAGASSASVDATLVTQGSTQATLLWRFGGDTTLGNRCSDPTDEYAAVVLMISGGAPVAAAATCQHGVFAAHGVAASSASATLRLQRTATDLVFEAGSTTIATLALAALPTEDAGAARVTLFAGDAAGPATVELAALHVTGVVTWDHPDDRFVGTAPAFDVPALLEQIHGPLHQPLVINLRTINTVTTEMPSDLEAIDPATGKVDLSRPEVRQRYREAFDYLVSRLPDVPIAGFSVGNEIDTYVGSNATAWSQIAAFTADVIPYIRSKLAAGTPVSITATADGLVAHQSEMAAVLAPANATFVTYYPLAADFTARDPGVVAGDVAKYLAATNLPLLFAEAGYPSAEPSAACPSCTGSQARQAAFFHAMFAATDAHATDDLLGFSVTWLTDAPDATVEGWKTYYGVTAPAFVAYLATLGVRDQSGAPKQAWQQIQDDVHARGLAP